MAATIHHGAFAINFYFSCKHVVCCYRRPMDKMIALSCAIILDRLVNIWPYGELPEYADNVFSGSSEDWKEPWIRVLFQIGITFSALVLIGMAFSFCFGTIHMPIMMQVRLNGSCNNNVFLWSFISASTGFRFTTVIWPRMPWMHPCPRVVDGGFLAL